MNVRRAETITGSWTTLGSAVVGADGTVTFTDNAAPAGTAFYRISNP